MMNEMAILVNKEVKRVESIAEWGESFNDRENLRVAVTDIGKSSVSTVFLGMNHAYQGPPLWFETLVFGGPLDMEMERYTTWDEAEAGHKAMVERVKAASE